MTINDKIEINRLASCVSFSLNGFSSTGALGVFDLDLIFISVVSSLSHVLKDYLVCWQRCRKLKKKTNHA